MFKFWRIIFLLSICIIFSCILSCNKSQQEIKSDTFNEVSGENTISIDTENRDKPSENRLPWHIGSSILLLCVLIFTAVLLIKSYFTGRKLKNLVEDRTNELEIKTATLSTIFDSIPDFLFTKDTELRYTQCNESMARYFNFRRDDILNKTDLISFGLPANISIQHNNQMIEVIEDGNIRVLESAMPDNNGTVSVFETIHAPLLQNGKSIGVLGIARDITKHKEKEYDALAASRAKSDFLTNMSYEIITPLNNIIGFAELALDDKQLSKTKEYIGKLLENAEGLLKIINSVLDISKVESGNIKIEKIPFNLHDVFASCKTLITPKAAEKGLHLHFYAEPIIDKKPLGDPTRLRQALLNLMSNAVKYTNSGIIKLCAAVNNKTDNSITVHFTVKDSGIGMSPEQIEKLFEPYAQQETGTTRKFHGTKLGLPITKNIIEMMGGKLLVESALGIGTKFSFDIIFDTADIIDYEQSKQVVILKETEKPLFEGEILLCEDNLMNQEVICEHLSRVGLKTTVAENGKIGVEIFKKRKESGKKLFDLVLMDIYMPVMDGLEASAKIIELNTGVPIIAMTANIMNSDRDIYNISGMNECLSKPLTSNELWRCLLKYLVPISMENIQNLIDTNYILNDKQQSGNKYKSDKNFFRSLQLMFYKNNQTKIDEIVTAFNANDITLAHRLVHTLKTNAGQLHMKNLQYAAVNVENQLKDGKNLTTDESLNNLKIELNIVLAQLSKELSSNPDEFIPDYEQSNNVLSAALPYRTALESGLINDLFEELEILLAKGSPESLDYICQLRLVSGCEALIKQIEEFNFHSALSLLYELKKSR